MHGARQALAWLEWCPEVKGRQLQVKRQAVGMKPEQRRGHHVAGGISTSAPDTETFPQYVTGKHRLYNL